MTLSVPKFNSTSSALTYYRAVVSSFLFSRVPVTSPVVTRLAGPVGPQSLVCHVETLGADDAERKEQN